MSRTRTTLVGIGEGAAWGLAFFNLEELVTLGLGQPGLNATESLSLIWLYALIPAVFGGLASLGGLTGIVRSWAIWGGMAAILLGGKFSHMLNEKALPGLLGFPIALIGVTISLGVFLKISRDKNWLQWGGLVAAWLISVGGLTVNMGALASPLSKEALTWDAAIIILSIGCGLLVSRLLSYRPTRVALGLTVGALVMRWPVSAVTQQALPPASTHEAPPIVLIVVDTLRADHLGIYGHTGATSPNIDALAKKGWVYTQANSPSSWTLPATASLLTGRNPTRHGAGTNSGNKATDRGLNSKVPTLAEVLRDKGYTNVGFVTNYWLKAQYGMSRGFDFYDETLGKGQRLILQPFHQLGISLMQDSLYVPARGQADKAIRFINSQGEKGWFLLLHLMDPHGPYNPPSKHILGNAADYDDPVQRLYEAEIRYADEQLGRVFEALPEDAWIFLTSDHGEEFGEHPGAYDQGPIPPNTRHGHTLYQEVIHVPLIVRPPGGRNGVRIDANVGSIDVAETIAQVAGTTLGKDTDSIALPEVLGRGVSTDRPVLSEALRFGKERKALQNGPIKFIASNVEKELYDLADDPSEQRNLAVSQPDVLMRIEAQLPQSGTVQGSEISPDDRGAAQLKALGYTE